MNASLPGFHLELLTSDLTSFDAAAYGALLILDPEEPFTPSEVTKLAADVTERGLGLVVASDWHDPALSDALSYVDEFTSEAHTCGSGGSHVPALNALLAPHGIALRSAAYVGGYTVGGRHTAHRSVILTPMRVLWRAVRTCMCVCLRICMSMGVSMVHGHGHGAWA